MKLVEAGQGSALIGPQPWPLSVRAYRALSEMGLIPEKTELLYGQVFRKMSKSPLHAFLHQFLLELLRRCVHDGLFVRSEQPISCTDSEPEPELSVVRGAKEDYRYEHPSTAELVIEVCVASHDYDRSKLRAYATAAVKECWLVLGPEKLIEVHRQPAGEEFADRSIHGPGGLLTSKSVPEFTVELSRLFSV